jgi:uncharacterized protein YfaS (alpha-2-macroglobulin family)
LTRRSGISFRPARILELPVTIEKARDQQIQTARIARRLNIIMGGQRMSEKPATTLPGTVEKIIQSPVPSEPERAQIAVEGADHLYRELRIENTLTDENGEEVQLKKGAKVEVTVEADPEATVPKNGTEGK